MFDRVVAILADYKDLDPSTITMESTFTELGIDSLDTVELIMTMEDEFGLTVDLNEKLVNVGSIVKLLEASQND